MSVERRHERSMVPLALKGPAKKSTFGFDRLTPQSTCLDSKGLAVAGVPKTRFHHSADDSA